MRQWHIYTLKNPRTLEVRYVGFRIKPADQRLRHHIQESISLNKTWKHKWILSLVSIGLEPLMETIESGSGDGWQDAERKWIAFYRASGSRLTNATAGGDGAPEWGTPEQQRERIARARETLMSRPPEEKAEWVRKRLATMGPERRSAAARKANAAKTPEQLRQAGIKARARLSAEQRTAAAKRGSAVRTPEQRRAGSLKGAVAKTAEQRSAGIRVANSRRTFESRHAAAQKRLAGMTPEQRSEITRKGHAKRVMKQPRKSDGTGQFAASPHPMQPLDPMQPDARTSPKN
jgi:hypothetical protein